MLFIEYRFLLSRHVVITRCVSDALNFRDNPSSVCYYWYWAYGELVRFSYCLLEKIKAAYSLPMIDNFMLPNHLRFTPLEKKEFLSGSQFVVRYAASASKMSSRAMPGISTKNWWPLYCHLLQLGQMSGKDLAALVPKLCWVVGLFSLSFVQAALGQYDGIGLGSWLNHGNQNTEHQF